MELLSPEAIGGAAALVATAAGSMWWFSRRRRRDGVAAPAALSGGIRAALASTGRRVREGIQAAVGEGDAALDGVEEALLAADVGTRTTGMLVQRMRAGGRGLGGASALRSALRAELLQTLAVPAASPTLSARPWVVLVTGVNGVGKTTTIGKLAAMHGSAGRKVLVVAADTFRAAASDQLAVWAERAGADIIRHAPGADPSAVVFDGLRAARARGVDVVLVDTAGRLHTRTPLMDELGKVRRTLEREVPGAPHEVLLVLDATTGQNAINQARAFVAAAGVTGVVVTKLDGTAKGGMVVSVSSELGLPVCFVGVGEGIGDLRPFDAAEFVDGLLGEE